jgi:UDP-N-acetylglucosamine 2-epimerase
VILAAVREYVSSHPEARLAMHLGQRGYFALMRHAAFMLGNSSSGMIEAASLGLPVVDIGGRQRGRVHGGNVIHAPFESDRIEGACRQALAPGFRARAAATANPYGDGHAAERITEVLERTPIDERLLRKRFHDTVPASPAGGGA